MLVPKLRFKEFNDEWKTEEVGDSCNVLMCKRIFADQTSIDEEIPFYKIGTIGTKADTFISRMLFEEYRNKYNYPRKNELLITCSGTVGKCTIFDGKDSYYQDSNIVWIDNPTMKINNKFLYYLFSKVDWSKLNSTTITRIYNDNLRKLKLNYPINNVEQEKIANFLSLLDKKIKLQLKKIEVLKLYSERLSDLIFQQKIGFNNHYEEWNITTLGKIGFFQTSSIDKLTKENERKVFLVNYMDVYKHLKINNTYKKNLMVVSAKENQIINNNLLKGDILFTPSSETPDDIGHSVVIQEDLENAVYSYHLLRFRPTVKLNIMYSNYFCNDKSVRNQIIKYSTGATRFTVSVGNFSNIIVKLPSIDEQHKIGKVLSTLEDKYNHEKEKLEKISELKKGLMQNLFA